MPPIADIIFSISEETPGRILNPVATARNKRSSIQALKKGHCFPDCEKGSVTEVRKFVHQLSSAVNSEHTAYVSEV